MAQQFRIHGGWRLVLSDLGVRIEAMLKRAKLPLDLFNRTEESTIDASSYFRLWDALEAELGSEAGLRVGQAVNAEAFSPPLFAALCSADFNTAAARLSRYKLLVGPLTLDVDVGPIETAVVLGCVGAPRLPRSLGMMEMVFLTAFARLATRCPIQPIAVESPDVLSDPPAHEAFFGCAVTSGDRFRITFAAIDGVRPFLTSDLEMWSFLRPVLDRRLMELEASASTAERVHAALMELLPSGRASVDDVAGSLGVGRRSLQRRLAAENTTFQTELDQTREHLARFYLTESPMPSQEIAFLLGYDDANSFFRAFHRWTGTTPERVRRGRLGAG
ncbi:MAG: AraC family transcriptional regulator ligand-binding domain-containing protein [Myxococcota bacterium]